MKLIASSAFVLLTYAPLALASGPSDIDAALRAASDMEAQGSLDAARRQLRALMREVDAPLSEELGLRVCALWQRQNQLEFARRCYLDVPAAARRPDIVGHARYRAAALAVELGDEASGRAELTRLVDELPYTEGARRAFVLARSLHRDSGGAAQEVEFLLGVASRLAWVAEPGAPARDGPWARALLAEALVEVGRIRLLDRQDSAGALRVLQRAAAAAHGTTWEDDALIWTARAQRRAGEARQALATYKDLIDAQEESWFVGEYNSEFYDDALLELAQVLEESQRLDEAERAYQEVFRRAPNSRLVDDAAYRLALLHAQRRHDASPLQHFMNAYPDSRHTRALRASAP